jgi:hypothetical protein
MILPRKPAVAAHRQWKLPAGSRRDNKEKRKEPISGRLIVGKFFTGATDE